MKTHSAIRFFLLALLCPFAALVLKASPSLTLNVAIDNQAHDCRFLPSLTGVPEGVGITGVTMDLYEKSGDFSYRLLDSGFSDPLPAADFLTAFSGFQRMPDGRFADGLGYYHTVWHYYQLTVNFTDGSQAQVNSRYFRVQENPFHIFCAQVVTHPIVGSITHKPGSTTVYQLPGFNSNTGAFTTAKQYPYSAKVEDLYAYPSTIWTKQALVFGALPQEAEGAKNITWTLSGTGSSEVAPLIFHDTTDFRHCVELDHFGEETLKLNLSYTLKDHLGNDSIVNQENHQMLKMRLSTPCFAYDNAVYAETSTETGEAAISSDRLSGMIARSGIYGDTGATLPSARLIHLSLYTPLMVGANEFHDDDLQLQITVTDTKYPGDSSRQTQTTYGPFVYKYDNAASELGEVRFSDASPSDWYKVDEQTGEVTPIPHRLTITYDSPTHEFYFSQAKNISALNVSPQFEAPDVHIGLEPTERFRRYADGWYECLELAPIEDYQPGSLILSGHASVPESTSEEEGEDYYAVSSRWLDSVSPQGAFTYGFNSKNSDFTPALISHTELTGRDPWKWTVVNYMKCGDGSDQPGLQNRQWFTSPQYELRIGRAYMFAVSEQPQLQVSMGGEILPLAGEPATAPRRAPASPLVEAFVPSMSSQTFDTHTTITSIPCLPSPSARTIKIVSGGINTSCATDVFTPSGLLAASGTGFLSLPAGIYIARNSTETLKIAVR